MSQLDLSFTSNPALIVNLGSNVIYTLTLTWISSDPSNILSNGQVNNTFPSSLQLLNTNSSDGTFNISGNQLAFFASNPIIPGNSVSFTATAKVLQTGPIDNSAIGDGLDNTGLKVTSANNVVVAVEPPVPCLHPDTLVHTCDDKLVPISSLRKHDCVLNVKNKSVEIVSNMKFREIDNFIKIERNALGENQPFNDLIIRKGHPIIFRGKSINPERLINRYPGVQRIKLDRPVPVYSLCTKKRTFVMMEGIPVATWAEADILAETKYAPTML